MGITMQYSNTDQRYVQQPGNGYQMVYLDPKTGQLMQQNPASVKKSPYGSTTYDRNAPKYIPFGGQIGQTAYTPKPPVDFNNLPQITPTGAGISSGQPYVRPAPQAPQYTPQFDPTFIQQMMAQRFGNTTQQGIPAATQLLPPTQGQAGGLATLNASPALGTNIGNTIMVGSE